MLDNKSYITPHDAVAQGRGAWTNPHTPDTAEYYRWHEAWHKIMAEKTIDRRLAEQYRKLALIYDRMADDAGAL